MAQKPINRSVHWQGVYQSRDAESVSWYRPHLHVSLELLDLAGIAAASRLIDIGGGASTLVDDLLDRRLQGITVLDLSTDALAIARRRLGTRERDVTWLASDILQVTLETDAFDFWHDRAVLHFLTSASETARYAQQAAGTVRAGGHAVIGGFAPHGPERCSGLPVARRTSEDIASILAPAFRLRARRVELHITPAGIEQPFEYALLQRC